MLLQILIIPLLVGQMSEIIKQSFDINLSVMHVFGLYSPRRNKLMDKVQAYVMYFLCIYPVPLLGCFYLLFEEDIDLVRVADNAFLLAEMGCYITKFFPFINNGDQIRKCIHYFEDPFFTVSNNKQKKILNDCIMICQRITRIFLLSVTGSVVTWAVKPFFWNDYRLPVDVWLPFNPLSELKVYYSTYLFFVLGVIYAAYGSGAIDPLIAGLACQATGQLKVLKNNLEHLNKYMEEEKYQGKNKKVKTLYNKIRQCIDHHNAILNFVKEYEECFSLSVFSQFVGSVIVICVSCLQLSIINPFTFNFLSMVIYLITMLAEIYLYCYYGTTLFEESNTLTDAIFMGEWYNYDMKSKKALIILMEHSKKPMVVTAGKVLDVSLVTFTSIIKKSYSLLAVLKNY